MGITNKCTSRAVMKSDTWIKRTAKNEKIIAVAGNPNVGKSTVFNALTGMKQHTGNWPGKTVANAQGRCKCNDKEFILVDIPGTYSIMSTSEEEEIARDFICFGGADACIVIVDATCMERNLNLVLQILEITKDVVVCVNLMDQAQEKKIHIDLGELSLQLGVPVVGTDARRGKGLENLMEEVYTVTQKERKTYGTKVEYSENIEAAITEMVPDLESKIGGKLPARWVSIKLLDIDIQLSETLSNYLGEDLRVDPIIKKKLEEVRARLPKKLKKTQNLRDEIAGAIIKKAEDIYSKSVYVEDAEYNRRDRKIDKILTSKATGIPIMLVMLFVVLWLTLTGANYPSEVIARGLFYLEDKMTILCESIGMPWWLHGSLVQGVYKTLAWVVAVMLPPMAIFFPLFTLMEDSGYLPRVAFNLDKLFKKAGAHGKQSLTMCMGFGCNACGVIGCRIIDSPRERLIAIITNNFVPCNGRFPTLIAIITMFFAGAAVTYTSLLSAGILTAVILLGVLSTLAVSKVLSTTVLKGIPSSFALELPPYRSPQIGRVIVRSIFDRTLFVLGRAVAVAAPAGLIIWLLSNITVGDISILRHVSGWLDPLGHMMGMDGVILMAFILGFPANEIVMPIIVMSYMCTGILTDLSSLEELRILLLNNGWTIITAICTMLFSLMHFPCGTTCLTIKKETGSLKWTAISFIVPTVLGIITCMIVAAIGRVLMC